MNNVADLRRSLSRGFLLTGIFYGITVLAVLALTAVTVGAALGTRAADQRLRTLHEEIGDSLRAMAMLCAEPSRGSWDAARQGHEGLQATARAVEGLPGAESAEIGRLSREVLAERFLRLSDAVEASHVEGLGSSVLAADEFAQALRAIQKPAAEYLRTIHQLAAEVDRALTRSDAARSQGIALLLAVAAVVASLGLGGATAFLASFARMTVIDAGTLLAYASKVARGDYPDDQLPVRADALGEIATVLRKLTRLEKCLYDVREMGAGLQGRSRNLDSQVSETASRASAQGTRLESAVRMLDDIVQAIQSVYTNARRSLETAEESGKEIDRSIQKLLEGASQVAQLGSLTNRIEEIVALISSIADQTDILSLNAGIEAARAGPYGRGFTVVATEVRKLADRSGKSALEISELTQSILSVVQKIATRTDEESFVMSSIQKGLQRITEAVGKVTEVSAAARDNVERLSKAIDEITGAVVDAQRDATEIVKTVRGVRGDVDRLRGLGSELGFSVSTASFAAWAVNAAPESDVSPRGAPAVEVTEAPLEEVAEEAVEAEPEPAPKSQLAPRPAAEPPADAAPVEGVEAVPGAEPPLEAEPEPPSGGGASAVKPGGAEAEEEALSELEPVD